MAAIELAQARPYSAGVARFALEVPARLSRRLRPNLRIAHHDAFAGGFVAQRLLVTMREMVQNAARFDFAGDVLCDLFVGTMRHVQSLSAGGSPSSLSLSSTGAACSIIDGISPNITA